MDASGGEERTSLCVTECQIERDGGHAHMMFAPEGGMDLLLYVLTLGMDPFCNLTDISWNLEGGSKCLHMLWIWTL